LTGRSFSNKLLIRLLARGSLNRAERPSLLERMTFVAVQTILQASKDLPDPREAF
jgi:hypothetical protein